MVVAPNKVADLIRGVYASDEVPRADWGSMDVPVANGSSFDSPDGHLCGLFAVDIAGFNGCRRDEDIQICIHKSLYEMLRAAFDKSDVPWFSCAREDRGDGVLVIVPPMIPVAGLVDPTGTGPGQVAAGG